MRIVFLGTPDFALPSLRAAAAAHEVAGVVCQPDRPQGRKMALTKPPVKLLAEELGLPVYQFEKLRSEGVETLASLHADIMVTCAYGQILTQEILDLCPHGVINVHGSLLPKYRGAAPVQWAVINGERETGVTIMQTARGLDCGDIILAKRTPVGERETAGELFSRLAELGAEALIEALALIDAGKAVRVPQDESEATYFPMLKKEDGRIDFSRKAKEVADLVRGVNPWPGAFCELGGELLKVWRAEVVSGEGNPGEILCADARGLVVACADGGVRLAEVQLSGGKRMSDVEFLRGHSLKEAK